MQDLRNRRWSAHRCIADRQLTLRYAQGVEEKWCCVSSQWWLHKWQADVEGPMYRVLSSCFYPKHILGHVHLHCMHTWKGDFLEYLWGPEGHILA